MDIKQFKFSSGEEILAEIVEWPEPEEKEIAVKNVMKLQMAVLPNGTYSSYLKPWFFDQDYNTITLLNSIQMVAVTQPSNDIKEDYFKVVKKLQEYSEGALDIIDDLDEEENKDDLSDEELLEYFKTKQSNRLN